MVSITTSEQADELLAALGEQLAAAGRPYELVVIGGAALLALGFVDRATRDVDLLALRTGDEFTRPDPVPTELAAAAERVGRDFGLPRDWLNAGPASMRGHCGRRRDRSRLERTKRADVPPVGRDRFRGTYGPAWERFGEPAGR